MKALIIMGCVWLIMGIVYLLRSDIITGVMYCVFCAVYLQLATLTTQIERLRNELKDHKTKEDTA